MRPVGRPGDFVAVELPTDPGRAGFAAELVRSVASAALNREKVSIESCIAAGRAGLLLR